VPLLAHPLKILIILFIISCGSLPVTTVAAPQPVTEGWEYHWSEISLMDNSELMLYILKNSFEDLSVAGFSLLVAFLALASSVMLIAES